MPQKTTATVEPKAGIRCFCCRPRKGLVVRSAGIDPQERRFRGYDPTRAMTARHASNDCWRTAARATLVQPSSHAILLESASRSALTTHRRRAKRNPKHTATRSPKSPVRLVPNNPATNWCRHCLAIDPGLRRGFNPTRPATSISFRVHGLVPLNTPTHAPGLPTPMHNNHFRKRHAPGTHVVMHRAATGGGPRLPFRTDAHSTPSGGGRQNRYSRRKPRASEGVPRNTPASRRCYCFPSPQRSCPMLGGANDVTRTAQPKGLATKPRRSSWFRPAEHAPYSEPTVALRNSRTVTSFRTSGLRRRSSGLSPPLRSRLSFFQHRRPSPRNHAFPGCRAERKPLAFSQGRRAPATAMPPTRRYTAPS